MHIITLLNLDYLK